MGGWGPAPATPRQRWPLLLLLARCSGVGAAKLMDLCTGDSHSCAILQGGSLRCWGANGWGQLGLGDTHDRGGGLDEMGADLPAVKLGTGRAALRVACGAAHTCAMLDDGSVKCWGANAAGQLGLGHVAPLGGGADEMGDRLSAVDLGNDQRAVDLCCGMLHTCVILKDGTVKCWGDDAHGQLGLFGLNRGLPARRGVAPGQMGDMLPPLVLGTGHAARLLSCGGLHTCVAFQDGGMKCWGGNAYGQLGLGHANPVGVMGDSLPLLDLGIGFVAVLSCGFAHTCVVSSSGVAKCWGHNSGGQLGLGDLEHRGDGVGEMGSNLPAVDLGVARHAASVSCGRTHSCALLDDGSVKCWGLNYAGQLGLTDLQQRGITVGTMGDRLPAVSLGSGITALSVRCGASYSCAVLKSGDTKCWGQNDHGQLGLGDCTDRGGQLLQLGAGLMIVDLGVATTTTTTATATTTSGTTAALGAASSGTTTSGTTATTMSRSATSIVATAAPVATAVQTTAAANATAAPPATTALQTTTAAQAVASTDGQRHRAAAAAGTARGPTPRAAVAGAAASVSAAGATSATPVVTTSSAPTTPAIATAVSTGATIPAAVGTTATAAAAAVEATAPASTTVQVVSATATASASTSSSYKPTTQPPAASQQPAAVSSSSQQPAATSTRAPITTTSTAMETTMTVTTTMVALTPTRSSYSSSTTTPASSTSSASATSSSAGTAAARSTTAGQAVHAVAGTSPASANASATPPGTGGATTAKASTTASSSTSTATSTQSAAAGHSGAVGQQLNALNSQGRPAGQPARSALRAGKQGPGQDGKNNTVADGSLFSHTMEWPDPLYDQAVKSSDGSVLM